MPDKQTNEQMKATAVAATLEARGPSRSLWVDGWFRLIRNKGQKLCRFC